MDRDGEHVEEKPVEQGQRPADEERSKLPDGGKSERVQREVLRERRDRGYRQ